MTYCSRHEVRIPIGDLFLAGDLNIPRGATGLVIFSHGSGSSRFSVRNRFVAEFLNEAGIATLLIDLLSEEEDRAYERRFDIKLLTSRLVSVTEYVIQLPAVSDLSVGYFGSSTGAASALRAAAHLPGQIHSVVSRGGRPDLAAGSLNMVVAPTLLIVGSVDTEVLLLNRRALNMLQCLKELEIIEGAGHLFEEPGKLTEVAELARNWFSRYLLPKRLPVLNHENHHT